MNEDDVVPGSQDLSLSHDDWGTIYRMLDEFGPMIPVLDRIERDAPSLRTFTRWLFSFLDTLAFALKRVAENHASRQGMTLSPREREVLQVIAEPQFPGMPPPRRRDFGLRESLGVALGVYARTRGVESPLIDGKLPPEFIDASVVFDRISRPSDGSDLIMKRADFIAIGKLVVWFREFQQWLHAQRLAEMEEIRKKIAESTAEAIRRIEASRTQPE
jgi:hypothetical protein